ncbi:MAG: hypothetical protein KA715_14520 [Xanthomonadaceae bacterium]|nr:hypothetical protein [Xanthomonadaceae bacterium]
MRTYKRSHQLLFGVIALVLTVGLGFDSPPALIDYTQKTEAGLLFFEKQLVRAPEGLGSNGQAVLEHAKKHIEPLKREIEAEALRVSQIIGMDYVDEERNILEASLRYINLLARTYYLYAKAAHYPKNDISKMNFSVLNNPAHALLDIRIPRRIGLSLFQMGTYLTPRHDSADPKFLWFTLPQSDRLLAEMFALSRNEEGDLALTNDFEATRQSETELLKRYRKSVFRIKSEQEYAKLLQFITLRETLFNRWVINRFRSEQFKETPVNSCGNSSYLNFKTSSSAYPEKPSQLLAYTGWAEQEELIFDLNQAQQKITPIVGKTLLATDQQHLDVLITLMRTTPGFDFVKQTLQADYDVKPSEELSYVKYQIKDDKNQSLGKRVNQTIASYWKSEGEKIIISSNFPSDGFKPEEMSKRVAVFSYESARDAATAQIATDLINMKLVQESTSYDDLVHSAEKIYDAQFKENYLTLVKAVTQIPFEQMRNHVVKAGINRGNLDRKATLLFEAVKPILPWVKEYRELRMYALRSGFVKEYNSNGLPTESLYEHRLLNQKSRVPHYGQVDSFPAVLMQAQARLGLEPFREVVEWFRIDSEFANLYKMWLEDAVNEYGALVEKNESQISQHLISRAFKSATEKLRERAKPGYRIQLGNWVSENVETTPMTITDDAKKAIVDWLSKSEKTQKKEVNESQVITEDKTKKIAEWIKALPSEEQLQEEPKVDPRLHGSIRRDQISTGFVPGPILKKKVEKLIEALGFSGEIEIDDSKILKTDFDRLQYAHARMAELVVAEPILGIPMYDHDVSLVMEESATYLGDGISPGLSTGKDAGTKTRSGRVKHAPGTEGMIPQYTQLIEQMASVYMPLGTPPLRIFDIHYNESLARQLVSKAIDTAARNGEGLFETFCQADPKKWKVDEKFKKIFIASVTLRKAMMGADKQLEEIDLRMQKELRSTMQYLQEEWFMPTMTFLFWASIVFLAFTFPLSPLAAVTTHLIKSSVGTILMSMASGAMFWGLNGAMVGNMVSRTYVNFYEKPIEVKFAQSVAAQNFGNTDKTIISWAETMSQQHQLKESQSAATKAILQDGLFTALFLSQAKMMGGFTSFKASKEIGLTPKTIEERIAQSMTSKEQVKAFQLIEDQALGKPSLMNRVTQDLSRRAGKISRYLPKYQNFTYSEILEGVRKTLKIKLPAKVAPLEPELNASIDFLMKRNEASKMTLGEVVSNPHLYKFWLRPRVWFRNAKNLWNTGDLKYLNLNQGADALIERVNALRRVYIHEKLEMARSIQAKLKDAMNITDDSISQGEHFINTLTDEEISLLGDLAEGPGLWWNQWYKGNSGPLYLSVARTSENFKTVLRGFSPVEYRPIKPWWESHADNKQIAEFEKALSGQVRKPNPLRDLDFLELEAIDSIYKDLVNRGIVSEATGQILKPLSTLTEVDKRLLEKYLRGMNFKVGMTQAGLDFKKPSDVSQYQDIIEFYDQMQALDGMKVLRDKEYEALRESLDRYLAAPDRSLEQLVNEYKPR